MSAPKPGPTSGPKDRHDQTFPGPAQDPTRRKTVARAAPKALAGPCVVTLETTRYSYAGLACDVSGDTFTVTVPDGWNKTERPVIKPGDRITPMAWEDQPDGRTRTVQSVEPEEDPPAPHRVITCWPVLDPPPEA